VVWQDNTTGNYDVYIKSSHSNGTKFKPMRNLSKNNGTSELPQIAVLNNDFYVIWKDSTSGTDRIFFRHGQEANSTNMTNLGFVGKIYSNGNVSKPKIIAGPMFFYGVWTSNLNKNNATVIEFYPFKLFKDYAESIIPLSKISVNENIANISMFVYNSDTYLAWENKNVGNGDIFLKRLSTGFFDRNS
jgi:hypothetical protein